MPWLMLALGGAAECRGGAGTRLHRSAHRLSQCRFGRSQPDRQARASHRNPRHGVRRRRDVARAAADLAGFAARDAARQKFPAKGEAVMFNAMPFNTAAPGRRLRFEIDLDQPAAAPLAVEVMPVDCAAGQPRLILPVTGRVLVYDGYDALSHHRRSDFRGDLAEMMGITGNFQRFGIDLVASTARAGCGAATASDVGLARLGPAGARRGGRHGRRGAQRPARQCRIGQRRQMGRAEEGRTRCRAMAIMC